MVDLKDKYNTPWRKMSTAIYAPPNEGKVYGSVDMDVTEAIKFIEKQRGEGKYITLTHIATAALGRTLKYDVPEINAFVRRGKLVPRDDVVVTVAVNMGEGGEMGSVRIREAHRKTVFEIAGEIIEKAKAARSGTENKAMRNKYIFSKIPWPFRRWLFRFLKWLTNELGFQLKSLGLTHNAFGSILLSNIGSHGLSIGMGALFPASKLPAAVFMGYAEEKPVVRNGEIVIRTIMPVAVTIDHRMMDGYHGGKLASSGKRYIENPELLANPPKEETETG